jgi:tetratricopeptide (TPR) repeat protein
MALVRNALQVALEHDKPSAALRAYYNLADCVGQTDRLEESAELAHDGLELARRVGNRYWEWSFLGFAYPSFARGDWAQVVAREDDLPIEDWTRVRIAFATLLTALVPTRVHRGEVDAARRFRDLFAELEASADLQEQAQVHFAEATLDFADGRFGEALQNALASLDTKEANGIAYEAVKDAFVVAVEAALALDDVDRAEELLRVVDELPPGHRPRFLQAHSLRFRGRMAARREDAEQAEHNFASAVALFRELGLPFCLAVTLVEQGEWLSTQTRLDEVVVVAGEASEIFERLEAAPWLERVARTLSPSLEPGALSAPS